LSQGVTSEFGAPKFNINNGEQEVAADGELDVVDIFKEYHTSRKKGLTDIAKEAIVSLILLYTFPASSYISLIETILVWKLRWHEMSIVFIMMRWLEYRVFSK
jgi:hypothetical protein